MNETNNSDQAKPGCFQVGLGMVFLFGGSILGFAAAIGLIGSQTLPDESVQLADVKGFLMLGSFIGAVLGMFTSFFVLSFFSKD